jgi:microcystin-dependent protein
MFAGNFAPRGWAFCDGQLLAVPQSQVLFSLLGTIYGGDGRTTFALPDLRGRIPVHAGSGLDLIPQRLGAKAGTESETITGQTMPTHTHNYQATTTGETQSTVPGNLAATRAHYRTYMEDATDVTDVAMSPGALSSVGGSGSHTNVMPFLCVNFMIALFGLYPFFGLYPSHQ